jgi:hypothetical protein
MEIRRISGRDQSRQKKSLQDPISTIKAGSSGMSVIPAMQEA